VESTGVEHLLDIIGDVAPVMCTSAATFVNRLQTSVWQTDRQMQCTHQATVSTVHCNSRINLSIRGPAI